MPLHHVQADPVPYLECPKCRFPLSMSFFNAGFRIERIIVTIACGNCCWSENWGELKKREVNDGSGKIEQSAGR